MGQALLHLALLGEQYKTITIFKLHHFCHQPHCLTQVVVLAPASFYLEEAFEALNFHHDRQVG